MALPNEGLELANLKGVKIGDLALLRVFLIYTVSTTCTDAVLVHFRIYNLCWTNISQELVTRVALLDLLESESENATLESEKHLQNDTGVPFRGSFQDFH